MSYKERVWLAVFFLCCIFSLMTTAQGAIADDGEYAAAVTVIHDDVAIRRVNTDEWLPLKAGAEAPLGVGDTLRTDENSRAFVRFGDAAEFYLLPNSTLELLAYGETPDGGIQLGLYVRGVAIQRTFNKDLFDDYRLITDLMTITEAADWFGVWAYGQGADVLTVAEGLAIVRLGRTVYNVPAGNAFLIDETLEALIAPLDPPYSAPRFQGKMFGCAGVVDLVGYENINVRVGPGFDYTVIGFIEDGARVKLMGITESGRWYRIQAFNGFGWLRSTLIDTTCTNIRTYPDGTIENNLGLRGITPQELAMVAPFYGTPEEDRWFFISLEGEEEAN
ncbi:MAG: hypothetical protein D6712_06175 [Chloroflexi bacterium]|nr:MAG: hypothetical protein D6712_06175 [Chloroflexota bacterium]